MRRRVRPPGPEGGLVGAVLADFPVQLIQRVEDATKDVMAAGRQAIHPWRIGPLGLSSAKPAALRHPRQHRIQRAGTQAIAVVMQFLEHPLTVDALFSRVVQDVDLPEAEQEFAHDRIAHDAAIIAPAIPVDTRFISE